MSLTHQQNAPTQQNNVLSHFTPTCFGIYCAFFRENVFCMLKTIVTLCGYTGLKLLNNHLKDHVCFHVELKT